MEVFRCGTKVVTGVADPPRSSVRLTVEPVDSERLEGAGAAAAEGLAGFSVRDRAFAGAASGMPARLGMMAAFGPVSEALVKPDPLSFRPFRSEGLES